MKLQPTRQHRREWLQGIEGTFEPPGLHCGGQQPEGPVLKGEAESHSLNPTPEMAPG